MALSNIFREPRREITESVVGILLVSPLCWADYAFAVWARDASPVNDKIPLVAGLFFGVIILIAALGVLFAFLVATHAIGDGVCNMLQRRGVHLRPRERR